MNAIVGDNGIITNAQKANVQSGIAVLEEYLQEEYVRYYDDADNYSSKVELLNSKTPNLLFKNGTKNYFVYDGNAYYLINKGALPEKVQKQLIGGDTSDKLELKNLYDIYGVNEDLTVYYKDNSSNTNYGNINPAIIDPNTKCQQINTGDTGLKNVIVETLSSLGIEIDPELGITVGNVSSIKELTLDGSKNNINSLAGIAELTSLRELTLKNLTLTNLDGIENCSMINYIYLSACNITDNINGYKSLASLLNLKYLYLYLPSAVSTDIANNQVVGMTNGLKDATKITKLEYLGIIGSEDVSTYIEGNYGFNYDPTVQNNGNYPEWAKNGNASSSGNVTDISSLNNIPDNIKSTVKYMYLYNNNINSIESLKNFKAINQLWLWHNTQLSSLTGLENNTSLTYLIAPMCGFSDLSGLKGCSNLYYLLIARNTVLSSLSGIKECSKLVSLYAMNCSNLSDISDLKGDSDTGLASLYRIDFTSCSNLEDVSPIAKNIAIRYMFLSGCKAQESSYDYWIPIDTIVGYCGIKCILPTICNNWLSSSNVRDYSVANISNSLIDNSSMMESLKGKTKVVRLSLKNNASLSNAYLNEVLSTLTGMQYLQLYGCSKLTSAEFISKMPNLKELDLRGTNITDLTSLENMINSKKITGLKTLIIDNISTDMTKIQATISFLWGAAQSDDYSSWVGASYVTNRGICLIGNGYDFSECTSITAFYSACNYDSGTIDLSECTSLTRFKSYGSTRSYILPSSLTYYKSRRKTGIDDLSDVIHLATLESDEKTENFSGLCATFNSTAKLDKISLSRYYGTDFSFIYNMPENVQKSVITFSHTDNIGDNSPVKSLTGLEKLTNVTSCSFRNLDVSSLSEISNLTKCTSLTIDYSKVVDWKSLTINDALTTLYINYCSLNALKFLNNVNNLTILSLANNNLTNLNGILNCVKLKSLLLYNNYISDIRILEGLISEEKTNLTNLNLTANPIGNDSLVESDNIKALRKLKSAGTSSITLTDCNLTEDF